MKLIAKKNIYLLSLFVISLLLLVLGTTYAKFPSSYTTNDNIVGLVLDFNVSITSIEEYQTLSLAPNEKVLFNVQITNNTGAAMAYGVWYRTSANISIGKLEGSATNTSGNISDNSKVTVEVIILNNTSNNIEVDVGVGSSDKTTSDIEYLNGKKLITGVLNNFLFLSDVDVGSYVKYVGNNGCSGKACEGQNINYVSDSDMGACDSSSTTKFKVNGWRVAYSKYNSAYLVSAGSPECFTGSDSITPYENIENINKETLKYCNPTYAYGGECNSNSTWDFNANDFEIVSGETLWACQRGTPVNQNPVCGYGNTIIDIGGTYFLGAVKGTEYPKSTLRWRNDFGRVGWAAPTYIAALRPVIRLNPEVYVTGGSGTYEAPYTIAVSNELPQKNTFTISFNSNYGSTCPTTKKTVTQGEVIGDLCTPTRDGFVFTGWYEDMLYRDEPMRYYCDINADLYNAFQYDYAALYNHWINYGQREEEGRRLSQYLSTDIFTRNSDVTLYAGWYKAS